MMGPPACTGGGCKQLKEAAVWGAWLRHLVRACSQPLHRFTDEIKDEMGRGGHSSKVSQDLKPYQHISSRLEAKYPVGSLISSCFPPASCSHLGPQTFFFF